MPQHVAGPGRRFRGRRAAVSLVFVLSVPCLAQEAIVPDDYASIGAALDAVAGTADATVIVEPGTYREMIAIPDNVVLRGRETARTFLTGTGEGPVLTANGTRGSRISNFTFVAVGNDPAVFVSAGSDLRIANNVFALGADGTAIRVEAAAPTVEHNVFYQNGVAVNTGGNALGVANNAFVGNTFTLTPDPVSVGAVTHNGFFDNDDTRTFGSNPLTGAPQFVSTNGLDFHLRTGSPYIDAGTGTDVLDGTTADVGAYGGPDAEKTPFPPETPTVTATGADSISLRWPASAWYRLGGYRLYYDSDGSGAPYDGSDAAGGSSPIDVGNVTEYTLAGLAPASPPGAPVLQRSEPRDGALRLVWSEVPGAAGYVVNYGIAAANEHAIDVGDVTDYTLAGLENGTTYRVAVNAYATGRYYLAVAAYAGFDDTAESALSQEISVPIGDPVPGPVSNELSDFPEPLVPFPNLPEGNGCFIATAAYGHYSANEVQRLRAFRDRYLLTHAPGRAFVAWYYRHSPGWVEALEARAWLKPAVRLALLPAVGMAGVALDPRGPVYLAGFVLLALLGLAGLRRWGGCRT